MCVCTNEREDGGEETTKARAICLRVDTGVGVRDGVHENNEGLLREANRKRGVSAVLRDCAGARR